MQRLTNSCRRRGPTKQAQNAGLKGIFEKRVRGQSTVEYIMMVAFGALFALQIVRVFNDIFRDGLTQLETTVQAEVETGRGFGGQ